jgi:membrane-bound lytic murein transglycosylase B
MTWAPLRLVGGMVFALVVAVSAGGVDADRVVTAQTALVSGHDPDRNLPPQEIPDAPPPLRPKAERTPAVRIELTSDFARQIAVQTDIPARAAQAYLAAAGRVAGEQPQCGIGWNTLAAIGSVESEHGTIGGSTLKDDGVSIPLIVGPALAPGSGFAAIRPTRQYAGLHGNRHWDHALGPMQFIGSTWARWGSDGDADATSNPFDVDDAALSAARYLCASWRPLTRQVWNDAILSYNHDLRYAAMVFDRAIGYAGQVD